MLYLPVMPPSRRRTPQPTWQEVFCQELAAGATVTAAAETAKISRRAAYDARERDEQFAAAWDDAYEQGTDVLEKEAWRRAVEGTVRPVFHQGVEVGGIREFSDRLLEISLKARRPHRWRESFDVRHSGQIKQLTASELNEARTAGLDAEYEQAVAKVASLDAARERRKAAG